MSTSVTIVVLDGQTANPGDLSWAGLEALGPCQIHARTPRRPGVASPMWNVYATLLRRALRPYGAQARLARYLGIPPQRLSDFLTGRRRLPDAELTLRLLHWLAELRTGRDVSL